MIVFCNMKSIVSRTLQLNPTGKGSCAGQIRTLTPGFLFLQQRGNPYSNFQYSNGSPFETHFFARFEAPGHLSFSFSFSFSFSWHFQFSLAAVINGIRNQTIHNPLREIDYSRWFLYFRRHYFFKFDGYNSYRSGMNYSLPTR
jgi:hypothetical protein